MRRLLMLAAAAALVAPVAAHATGGCRPYITVDKSTTPPTVQYKGMVC